MPSSETTFWAAASAAVRRKKLAAVSVAALIGREKATLGWSVLNSLAPAAVCEWMSVSGIGAASCSERLAVARWRPRRALDDGAMLACDECGQIDGNGNTGQSLRRMDGAAVQRVREPRYWRAGTARYSARKIAVCGCHLSVVCGRTDGEGMVRTVSSVNAYSTTARYRRTSGARRWKTWTPSAVPS